MKKSLARPPVERNVERSQSFIPPFSVLAKCGREHCHGDLVRTPNNIRRYTRPEIRCLLCGREYIKLDGAYILGHAQESGHNGKGRHN